jgi:hypothetical protein
MSEETRAYEALQAALDIIEPLIRRSEASCTILGAKPDEALIVGTADGYLVLARILLAFVLKVKCGIGPLEDLARQEFPETADKAYCTCDVGRAFATASPYRRIVALVAAYLADSEEGRRRIESIYEESGE